MTTTKYHHPSGSKKRIVFILPALSGGGAERVLITLMNNLDPARHERIFITINEDGPLRDLIAPGIPFHSFGPGASVGRSMFRLYKKLKELQPDIVMSTMAHMNFGVLLLKFFFPKTRFIVREAITPSYFSQRPWRVRFPIYMAYRFLYPYADMVISPAQKIIDEFRDLLKIDIGNHQLLFNPVDTDHILDRSVNFPPVTQDRNETVHFICAGRLDPQKGYDRLIDSVAALKMPCDWQLTILGEGNQREELEDRIEKSGLDKKIFLAGFVRTPWPLVAAADAFLMPSRQEGMPNAILEALACGTPVIATRSSGGVGEIACHAPAGAVTIVDTMDEFVDTMSKIRPSPTVGFRPSLLPHAFSKDAVMERFTKLLAQQGELF